MFIEEMVILLESGLLLLKYPPTNIESIQNDNKELVAGFLSALQSFSEEQYKAELTDYTVGNIRFDIYHNPKHRFYIVGKSKKDLHPHHQRIKNEILHNVAVRFQKEYGHLLKPEFSGEVTQFKSFNKNIQEILELTNPIVVEFRLDKDRIDTTSLPADFFQGLNQLIGILIFQMWNTVLGKIALYNSYTHNEEVYARICLWNSDEQKIKTLNPGQQMGLWEIIHIGYYLELQQTELLTEGNAENLFDVFFNHPNAYTNPTNPNQPIWAFGKKENRDHCEMCNEKHDADDLKTCVFCNRQIGQECMNTCGTCNAIMCRDGNCGWLCQTCKIHLCNQCHIYCRQCHASICFDCAFWDKVSQNYFCGTCWITQIQKNNKEIPQKSPWMAMKLARTYFLQNKIDAALIYYKKIIQTSTIEYDKILASINLAACYIRSDLFQDALKILKSMEVLSEAQSNYDFKRALLGGLVICYQQGLRMGDKNPSMIKIYTALMEKCQKELEDLKHQQEKSLKKNLDDVKYYQYRPPQVYRFSIRGSGKPMNQISLSPFDSVENSIREIVYKHGLCPTFNHRFYYYDYPLNLNSKLMDNTIDTDDELLELVLSPKNSENRQLLL